MTPQAACECELRGLDYLALEDFFDVTAFLDADEPMLALQGEWADKVDAFAWESLPELRALGLRPAGHYVFFLKVLIDTLYRAAFELSHLLHAAGPARLVYFEDALGGPVPETLFFPRSVRTATLPFLAEVYGAELAPQSRDVPGKEPRARGLGPALEQYLSPQVAAQLRAVKHAGLAGLIPWRPGSDRRPEVVCGPGYDVDHVAERLAGAGYRIRPLVEPLSLFLRTGGRRRGELRSALAELWPRLRAEAFFAEPFRWEGVDLLPLAEARLEHWWMEVVPAMWEALTRARERFERSRPQAVLLYSPWSPEDHGALQGARSLGVPTITVQHGGFEGNCEYTTYDLTDLRLADYRFVYGEGTAAYLRERAARAVEPRAKVVATGSARLDALRSVSGRHSDLRRRIAVPQGRPLVLYLAGSYQHRGWYMCRGAYLGVPYFRLLAQVVETFKRFPDVHFLYKPFPEHPLDPVARLIDKGVANVTVVRDIPVSDLFEACDAYAIDIPSTALLEALLTPKPVLTYADARFVRLRPEACELLRRRAVVSETPDAFIGDLEAFLSTSSFEELVDADETFLCAYGTHLNDGRSAERAAQGVSDVIATHDWVEDSGS